MFPQSTSVHSLTTMNPLTVPGKGNQAGSSVGVNKSIWGLCVLSTLMYVCLIREGDEQLTIES